MATPSVTAPQLDVVSHYVPPTQAPIDFLGPSLIPTSSFFSTKYVPVNTIFTASKPAEKLTQEQLFQRVIEVSYIDK